jgi:MerR family transcriptional regulator, repressor of the yfmOP operon
MTNKNDERPGHEPYLQIGEVADRTGVTQRTLRFYEERGLLKPPSRMEGGFRLYSEEDIQRVEQIKRLQNLLGLTLAEIKDMVEAEEIKTELRQTYRPDLELEEHARRMAKAIEVTEKQHAIIGHKVQSLLEMKKDLELKLDRYRTYLADIQERIVKESPEIGTR